MRPRARSCGESPRDERDLALATDAVLGVVGPYGETIQGGTWQDSPSAQESTASPRWARVSKLRGRASSQRADVAYTRQQVREAVERAGDEHWQALIRHHEDAYPASRPTPGDVCRAEAERLNQLGLADAGDLTLVETRVERTDSTIRIVHLFEYGPHRARLLTEPVEGYGSEEGEE
jgi:hypothetical protein